MLLLPNAFKVSVCACENSDFRISTKIGRVEIGIFKRHIGRDQLYRQPSTYDFMNGKRQGKGQSAYTLANNGKGRGRFLNAALPTRPALSPI